MYQELPTKEQIEKLFYEWFIDGSVISNDIISARLDYSTLTDIFSDIQFNNESIVYNKVALLNYLFGTQIPKSDLPLLVKNIVSNKKALLRAMKNSSAVEILRGLTYNRDEYSFATKFCHFSNPSKYIIYDKHVAVQLYMYRLFFIDRLIEKGVDRKIFRSKNAFLKFIRNYNNYIIAFTEFRNTGELSNVKTNREIEFYLYMQGRIADKNAREAKSK